MKLPSSIHRFVIFLAAVALLFPSAANARTKPDINQQLRSVVAKVRRAKTPTARLKISERLLALTHERDCSDVTDETIRSLISLLDLDDDGVQMWVAAVLGEMGPRAKASVPKLLSILAVSECQSWDHSSAATIPIAIKSMGVTPPPRDCHNL
jgi:hypothetical protein